MIFISAPYQQCALVFIRVYVHYHNYNYKALITSPFKQPCLLRALPSRRSLYMLDVGVVGYCWVVVELGE